MVTPMIPHSLYNEGKRIAISLGWPEFIADIRVESDDDPVWRLALVMNLANCLLVQHKGIVSEDVCTLFARHPEIVEWYNQAVEYLEGAGIPTARKLWRSEELRRMMGVNLKGKEEEP